MCKKSFVFSVTMFLNSKTPILIQDNESSYVEITVTECGFLSCTGETVAPGAFIAEIKSGYSLIERSTISDCCSSSKFQSFYLEISEKCLCAISLLLAYQNGFRSSYKEDLGSQVSTETVLSYSNLTDNTARWEPSVKLSSLKMPTSILYTLIENNFATRDVAVSQYGPSNIMRSASIINNTSGESDGTTSIRVFGDTLIESSNFAMNNAPCLIRGDNVTLRNCWFDAGQKKFQATVSEINPQLEKVFVRIIIPSTIKRRHTYSKRFWFSFSNCVITLCNLIIIF